MTTKTLQDRSLRCFTVSASGSLQQGKLMRQSNSLFVVRSAASRCGSAQIESKNLTLHRRCLRNVSGMCRECVGIVSGSFLTHSGEDFPATQQLQNISTCLQSCFSNLPEAWNYWCSWLSNAAVFALEGNCFSGVFLVYFLCASLLVFFAFQVTESSRNPRNQGL